MGKGNGPNKGILYLALALVACAVVYVVLANERAHTAIPVQAAIAAATPTTSPSEEITGVREPDFLLALHGAGLTLRSDAARIGRYWIAMGVHGGDYALTVSLSEQSRVNGFALAFPAIPEPSGIGADNAVGQALFTQAVQQREQERESIAAILPLLLQHVAPPGVLPDSVQVRWTTMAREARAHGGAQSDSHNGFTFRTLLDSDQALWVFLDP